MTAPVTDKAAYRILRRSDSRGKPAKYRATYGLELGNYALVRDQSALAELSTLPRKQPAGRKGILGSIKRFMAPSDRALISLSDRHPLPPPAALAMYLLYEELTDTSGG